MITIPDITVNTGIILGALVSALVLVIIVLIVTIIKNKKRVEEHVPDTLPPLNFYPEEPRIVKEHNPFDFSQESIQIRISEIDQKMAELEKIVKECTAEYKSLKETKSKLSFFLSTGGDL